MNSPKSANLSSAIKQLDEIINSARLGSVSLNKPHEGGKTATKSDIYARLAYVAGLMRAREVMAGMLERERNG
jgi:hypothetical protein